MNSVVPKFVDLVYRSNEHITSTEAILNILKSAQQNKPCDQQYESLISIYIDTFNDYHQYITIFDTTFKYDFRLDLISSLNQMIYNACLAYIQNRIETLVIQKQKQKGILPYCFL